LVIDHKCRSEQHSSFAAWRQSINSVASPLVLLLKVSSSFIVHHVSTGAGAEQERLLDGLWIEQEFSTDLETRNSPGLCFGLEPSKGKTEPLETIGQVTKCEESGFHAPILPGHRGAKCVTDGDSG
jgi:hypothetical protein